MKVVVKFSKAIFLGFLIALLGACSLFSSNESDYRGIYTSDTKTTQDSLEVPPDLVAPKTNDAFVIPTYAGSSNSDNAYSKVLTASSAGVEFVREGDVFWLVIKDKPDIIWNQVRNFFKDLGFTFVVDQPVNGILETNWLENRVDTPTGWFMSFLTNLVSTGIQDKYRIRLERGSNDNETLLFITHRGLKERVDSDFGGSEVQIYWTIRDSEPDLEAEMLQRFLVFRGVRSPTAKEVTNIKAKRVERAKLVKNETSNTESIIVNEIFSRAWRRVGIALDRMGLVIEDRNRSKGLYYIKTTDNFLKVNTEEKGWFSSSKSDLSIASFQLYITETDSKTNISILDASGADTASKTAAFILKKLNDQLR